MYDLPDLAGDRYELRQTHGGYGDLVGYDAAEGASRVLSVSGPLSRDCHIVVAAGQRTRCADLQVFGCGKRAEDCGRDLGYTGTAAGEGVQLENRDD